jgi:hypothetical protein
MPDDQLPGYDDDEMPPPQTSYQIFEENESQMINDLRYKVNDLNNELNKPDLKMDRFKYSNIKRLLNDAKTAITTNLKTKLDDFIKSPSKKMKMDKQNRKY